jgi:Zn-dependent oligopeptidase
MMQALAEGLALVEARADFEIDLARLAETWRHGSVVRSWLLDLGAEALAADPVAFEAALLESRGLPRAAGTNHRLVHFQHLFSSPAYAAGYYVYLWAEVLDADAYDAFREAGNPFDPRLAEALRRHVYAAGNTVEPGAAYLAFRGRPPAVAPLLRQRGLIAEPQQG